MVKLKIDDRIRIPPIRATNKTSKTIPRNLADLDRHILFKDQNIVVLNKPAGVAVHGGSGVMVGIIESLKGTSFKGQYLELVHRLDRETSGCLLLARNRKVLLELHRQFRREKAGPKKLYRAIVLGTPDSTSWEISEPLLRTRDQDNKSRVIVSEEGRPAKSRFRHSFQPRRL